MWLPIKRCEISCNRSLISCYRLSVILADEPTGNLDEDTAMEITNILKECAHQMNKCVVIVTHSNELAKQADVIMKLRKGELQITDTHDAYSKK